MQYLLLIYDEEGAYDALSDTERRALYAEYGALNEALRAESRLLSANQLQPTSTARTVRIKSGDTLVTDGPFAETKEVLGGYYLIEADSLEDAVDWAARIPSARFGPVEVRPVRDGSGGSS
jgi:hypothetical protein